MKGRAAAPPGILCNTGVSTSNAPFAFAGTPTETYLILDKYAIKMMEKEIEAKRYNELEELFELQISKYPEINETRTMYVCTKEMSSGYK